MLLELICRALSWMLGATSFMYLCQGDFDDAALFAAGSAAGFLLTKILRGL